MGGRSTTYKDRETERLRAALMADEAAVPTSTLGRMWRSGRSALGFGAVLRRVRQGEAPDPAAIAELVRSLGGQKGVAMKAGQMLGYFDPSLPPELREMMSLLQTAAPRMTSRALAEVVRGSLGTRAEALLAGMDPAPIAVASIGQVHRGRLPDGTEVAIKIRHPDIERAVAADFRAAGIGKLVAAITGGVTIADTIEEARAAFLDECDYSLEARHQQAFARLFADDPEIVIPAVEAAWSGNRVLVTRWTPGRSLDEYLAADPDQADRDRVGAALFRCWMRTLYRDGLFHGDPHPGNFAFCPGGQVVVYDFGCVRAFDPPLRRGFAGLAAATRDDDMVAAAAAIERLGGRAPRDAAGLAHLRELLRGFYGPLLTPGKRRIAADEGLLARDVMRDKRAILRLQLPGRMLFLFRLRFGLYAVLARLGSEVDWAGLEIAWARAAGSP